MGLRGYRSRFARVENPLPSLRSLPPQQWPADDLAAFKAARSAEDPLDEPGRASEWAAPTVLNRQRAYGCFLWLLREEGDLDQEELLCGRVTRPRVGMFLIHLLATVSPITARQKLLDLSFILLAMAPDRDWSWIRRYPGIPSEREANASRKPKAIVAPEDIIGPASDRLAELVAQPITLEAASEMMRLTVVIIGFYLKCRVRNLTGLRLGETLQVNDRGIWVVIPGNQTKTGMPIENKLGSRAEALLRQYLSFARPVLLGERKDPGALWLNQRGRGLSDQLAWIIFSEFGLRYLGYHISPHTTRRAFATAMQQERPDLLKTSAAGLSHKGVATFLGPYDQSGNALAQKCWDGIVKRAIKGK